MSSQDVVWKINSKDLTTLLTIVEGNFWKWLRVHSIFIHIHSTFYTHTPYFLYIHTLVIKLERRHARCTRSKLAVLQHKNIVEFLSWSSAFDTCKHDSNRAIFDVDYEAWNESFFKKLRVWCSSKRKLKISLFMCLFSSLSSSLLNVFYRYFDQYGYFDRAYRSIFSSTMTETTRWFISFICYITCLETRFDDYLASSEVKNEFSSKLVTVTLAS
jgi:hypothetical protein